jgi:hypothetical protein
MPNETATADEAKKKDEFARGQCEALIFMRRNPDFIPNGRNSETMKRELLKRGMSFSADNLQEIWDEVDRGLFDHEDDKRPDPKPPLQDTPPPVIEETFPWGKKLEGIEGKQRIAAMSREEFNKHLSNRHTGAEFQHQVEALGFQRPKWRHADE